MKTTLLMFLAVGAFAQEIAFDSAPAFLKLPEHTSLGEVAGVATNSRGHVYVYTRTGEQATAGASRIFTHGGSRLFEFDATGKYTGELGVGIYGFLFAQSLKIDAQDNIWTVDRGANVIVKFDPAGRVLLTLGRKPESVSLETRGPGRGGANGAGVPGDNFNRPTDIAFDSAGNIYVADGYANARIAKFDAHGKFVRSWGSKGSGQAQFNMPKSLAVDAQNNVYVADLNNSRIQVFDSDGNFKREIKGVDSPWALCISPGAHQYLYVSDSNAPESMDKGEIYKMELDGAVVGKFGRAGKLPKEFGTVNQVDCRLPNTLYVGEVTNWRVQKLTLH